MIKPAEMTQVSVTGPKKNLQEVIEKVYDMEILDLEEYDGELETGEPFEEAEDISQMLVDVRSLISKLPESERDGEFSFEELESELSEIKERVEEIESQRTEIRERLKSKRETLDFFRKIEGSGVNMEELRGTDRLEVFVGKFDREEFLEEVESDRWKIRQGENASIVFYDRQSGVEETLGRVCQEEYTVPELEASGEIERIVEDLKDEINRLESEIGQEKEQLEDISREWYSRLESAEDFLTEKVEKSEAPINFATTRRAFIAEGWIPSESFEEFRRKLLDATDDEIHVQEEQGETPPVKHDNPGPVKPFESLTDLVAIPKHNEIDPSFMILLTFPLMFGFMIGDAGYGLTTLAVFYAGYRKFPEASEIFKSLMYASVATIIFGLAFGDAFGYILFGHHSDLAHVTGIHLFEQIPILFHRAEHLGSVFNIAAIFGLVHVNLGYLLGAYNEYVSHGARAAFLEKGSWLVLEAGAALWFFFGVMTGAPVVVLSIAMLYLGEGIEGVVEIPSLLSNVLSYLRIFGVSVAAVALAGVVNAMAKPLFAMQSMPGLVGGIAVLMIGHTFNTFIKIMEGFLQGIRLHYVELFTKFFEGGGRKYVPFGSKEYLR